MGTARDIALIFLSIQALVISLIPLVLIGGLAYGIYRLNGWVRTYLQKAQVYVQMGHDWVERTTDAIAAPMIKVEATASAATTMFHTLKRMIRRDA